MRPSLCLLELHASLYDAESLQNVLIHGEKVHSPKHEHLCKAEMLKTRSKSSLHHHHHSISGCSLHIACGVVSAVFSNIYSLVWIVWMSIVTTQNSHQHCPPCALGLALTLTIQLWRDVEPYSVPMDLSPVQQH